MDEINFPGMIFMKIIVAGCGKIGSAIVKALVNEGHDITIIDRDKKRVDEIVNIYDVIGVCGGCVDSDTLSEANAGEADMFIATTNLDESNMLSCFFAKRMGAKHTIARIRDTDYNDSSLGFIKQTLGLSMSINPDYLAAKELFNILQLPSAVKIETFSSRSVEMIELKIKDGSPLDGMKLIDIREKYKVPFLVCTVQRGIGIYIPSGNFEIKAGDKIGITAAPSDIQKLLKKLDLSQKQAKDIMILGGSRTAYYLAKRLAYTADTIKIIEHDEERCNILAETLPQSSIINGDGAQQEILLEEGLKSMDAFVSLTGMDEENILMSVFAASKNVPKVISKINRDEMALMAENLGLDSIVTPSRIIANVILRYARALDNAPGSKVETLYRLMDGGAEALEFTVSPDFIGKDIPLKDLSLKRNTLIAGIARGRKTIIPSGSDCICADDRVIVISCEKRLNDLADILR